MSKVVYVGLSGGVDSSVAAALLKQQGYSLVGVYMKNWSKDLPGFPCPWKEDYQDAKRVAVQLGIPFKMFDFENQYRRKVVDSMIDQFKQGITPNPDITCNQEIKFKLFLDTALADGADMIATGHYAKIVDSRQLTVDSKEKYSKDRNPQPATHTALGMAKDASKDQTYFLYRVSEKALEKTLFPLGGYTKPEVRGLAKKFGLVTAGKKESMGICFVGKVGIKDFLKQYVVEQPGKIIDQTGQSIGRHDGAIFYTIGQRHGLEVGGGLPYYVTGKDMGKNEVYVTSDINDAKLWSDTITLASPHWINGESQVSGLRSQVFVRTRHRAPMVSVKSIEKLPRNTWRLTLAEAVRALTPGQSAVLYTGQVCFGGGIVV